MAEALQPEVFEAKSPNSKEIPTPCSKLLPGLDGEDGIPAAVALFSVDSLAFGSQIHPR